MSVLLHLELCYVFLTFASYETKTLKTCLGSVYETCKVVAISLFLPPRHIDISNAKFSLLRSGW